MRWAEVEVANIAGALNWYTDKCSGLPHPLDAGFPFS